MGRQVAEMPSKNNQASLDIFLKIENIELEYQLVFGATRYWAGLQCWAMLMKCEFAFAATSYWAGSC